MAAGDWIWVLGKSGKCSWLRGHLFSPFPHSLYPSSAAGHWVRHRVKEKRCRSMFQQTSPVFPREGSQAVLSLSLSTGVNGRGPIFRICPSLPLSSICKLTKGAERNSRLCQSCPEQTYPACPLRIASQQGPWEILRHTELATVEWPPSRSAQKLEGQTSPPLLPIASFQGGEYPSLLRLQWWCPFPGRQKWD